MLTSGHDQGRIATSIALDVMNGTNTSDIPVMMGAENRYVFDYRELQRFGPDLSSLPAGSRLVNLPYDLVIVDLTIPGGMGGLAAFQQMREVEPEVTGIVSSGYSTDPVNAEYRSYGFSGVIRKPYRLEDILRIVGKLLKERRKRQIGEGGGQYPDGNLQD
ncbi:MAG: Response regulator receiver domain protein [Methanoregulaceae archaeon PtaU1.Bin059]|nr:MAG: Response regulator receiver domain protein [Methanoregulaceae archaeon PtaU1.Bin059]